METKTTTIPIEELDLTTREIIELVVPEKQQKVVLTITRRKYFDPFKKKVITDQVVHRAKYRLGRKMK